MCEFVCGEKKREGGKEEEEMEEGKGEGGIEGGKERGELKEEGRGERTELKLGDYHRPLLTHTHTLV